MHQSLPSPVPTGSLAELTFWETGLASASWCDKLASTPTVGLKFEPHFASGDTLLNSLTPMLDPWADGEKQKFAIDQMDFFSLTLTSEDGFRYSFDQTRSVVEFRHRMQSKPVSGGPP